MKADHAYDDMAYKARQQELEDRVNKVLREAGIHVELDSCGGCNGPYVTVEDGESYGCFPIDSRKSSSTAWTSEPPTKGGYYWVQWVENDDEPEVVHIYESLAGPRVENTDSPIGVSHPKDLPVHAWWPEPIKTPWG